MVLVAAQPALNRLVTAALKSRGFSTRSAVGRALALGDIVDHDPDVVVVESEHPGQPLDAVRDLVHEGRVPIIVLAAGSSPASAARALDAGAADYIPRPFDPTELAARVRSVVRRRGARLASGRRRVGRATVDLEHREVDVDGVTTALARGEWRLLMRLLASEGQPVAHEALLAAAYGWEARDDLALLRDAIARLRRKLGAGRRDAGPIRTLRGFGYALDALRSEDGGHEPRQRIKEGARRPAGALTADRD